MQRLTVETVGCVGVLLCLAGAILAEGEAGAATKPAAEKYTVACYYFPNYHLDRRNEAKHGKGWSEWELVKAAKPRFEGHHQPNVPAWGYTDEADPKQMAQKIDAAADAGVDRLGDAQ